MTNDSIKLDQGNYLTQINQYSQITKNVEGWFSKLSIYLWDILLQYQLDADIKGNLIEIGAWHGKSAAMLLLHQRPQEKLVVVDIELREALRKNLSVWIEELSKNLEIIHGNSFTKPTPSFVSQNYRSMRWIHIDGDHRQQGVYNDLDIANQLLHPFGVIVVDDFLNERFPQISEVVFNYIDSHKNLICMVLCGGNKGYLVRPSYHEAYSKFLGDNLLELGKARGVSLEFFSGTSNNATCYGVRLKN